ncbi:hypothetical protein AWB78_05623 [Caballeronia calidae]|uniref:Uncharacterized protein n=2 Tax=Caballeronia calidae TaxID=1777139 RepID=A0A158DWS2_9BURK|nr:hypothetical protein AWB78_05623 [Caballeronia calidae]
MSTDGNSSSSSEIAPVTKVEGNPLQQNIRAIPTLQEAMTLTTRYPNLEPESSTPHEVIVGGAADTFVSNPEVGRAFVSVVSLMWSSYHDRDLRNPEYREYASNAAAFFRTEPKRGRHLVPLRFGIAPHAKARGMILIAPVRMGRRLLADILQSEIGSKPRAVRIPAADRFTDYLQLPCLRMHWPLNGELGGLAQGFFGAFDAAFNTVLADSVRSMRFRERDILPAMCTLGVAANLGLVIVERINVEDATKTGAAATWSAIAQFTRTTGIPVLCLATPGAVALGLRWLPGSRGDLTAAEPVELVPTRSSRDERWVSICRAQFDATLGVLGIGPMPHWLPDAAYLLTLGFPGLLANALRGIALHLATLEATVFNEKIFIKHGKLALLLETPDIDAVKAILAQRNPNPASLIKYSDWLPVAKLRPVISLPELEG